MIDSNQKERICEFYGSPVHKKITRQIFGIVGLAAIICVTMIQLLPTKTCNNLIPLTLLVAMTTLFYLGIRYQRRLTAMLNDMGLICENCSEATIPRPDRIQRKARNASHGIETCYSCNCEIKSDS